MNNTLLFFNSLVVLEAFVLSIYWLLDSNFSVLLSFTLIYFLFFVICLYLGYEFLGLIILLVYSTGITIMFIIGSMIIGGKTLLESNNILLSNSINNKLDFNNDNFIINSIIYVASIKIFFIFKFSTSAGYNLLINFLTVDYDSIILFTILTSLNDAFILGNLLFFEFSLHTVISGFILLTSLIGSLHVSMLSNK